jgi:hypothetical protein
MTKLVELAKVLRSKNAGPLYLTFDIMFEGKEDYNRVIESGTLTKKLISELYHLDEENVSIINYPAAYSVKITIPRRVISGEIGDTDIYGAQQHGPLLDVEVKSTL